jgi:anti-anti-sigma factor
LLVAHVQPAIAAGCQAAVVTLPGQIDMASAGQIASDLEAALATGVHTVIADMTSTAFCDCSGIRVLVRAHKQAAGRNAELRVVIPSARVRHVLALAQVDHLLLIHRSLAEALTV